MSLVEYTQGSITTEPYYASRDGTNTRTPTDRHTVSPNRQVKSLFEVDFHIPCKRSSRLPSYAPRSRAAASTSQGRGISLLCARSGAFTLIPSSSASSRFLASHFANARATRLHRHASAARRGWLHRRKVLLCPLGVWVRLAGCPGAARGVAASGLCAGGWPRRERARVELGRALLPPPPPPPLQCVGASTPPL